ncbi:hypothetical protein ACHAPT_005119 [Fusarium lateritium]
MKFTTALSFLAFAVQAVVAFPCRPRATTETSIPEPTFTETIIPEPTYTENLYANTPVVTATSSAYQELNLYAETPTVAPKATTTAEWGNVYADTPVPTTLATYTATTDASSEPATTTIYLEPVPLEK